MSGNVIISKGKNVKEAIEVGLQLLEATIQEVDIEIIESESKGFLGIGSKPAIVRLIKKRPGNDIHRENLSTKKDEREFSVEEIKFLFPYKGNLSTETTSSSSSSERRGHTIDRKPEADKDFGKVWVKDGRIYCKETSTHYPMITPRQGISLYKNGELVTKTTVISEKDKIKVELDHEIKHTEWSIELDEKKMTAILHIQPGYKKTCTLIDQEPSHHIQLEVKETIEVRNHLNPNHVFQKMQEMNIKTGIQKIEILKATETTDPGTFEIAKGIAPQKGKDGWLEILVDTEKRLHGPNKWGDGALDDRVIQSIANVNAGQVIAVIHPPQPGKPGVTVTGETVPPEPAQELEVKLGKGVDFIEKGSKIVALSAGRPKFEYHGRVTEISIIPKLLHTADVNVHSGHIRYKGDVEIQGNVDEGMLVDAIEDVLVHGNVNRANIQAGNRIFVNKNVINSHLTAGKRNPFIAELGQLLKKIHSQLESLSVAINQVYSAPGFKTSDIAKMGLSSLIRILLEKKFNTLPPVIKEYTQMIMKADQEQIINDEYKELGNELINGFFKLLPAHLKGPEDIQKLIKQVKSVYELSNKTPDPNASITIPYAFNSEIYCSGDIYIVGQGIMNTKVHSGGKVVVEGMLRGGEVYAEFGAEIGEAGTRGGIPTCIRVPDGQTIKIKYALEGTIVQIGNKSHQFLHFEKDVFARVDEKGYFLLH
jgi:uncharacterized protein (DUF342 family)